MTETTPTPRAPAALARMARRALDAEAAVARVRALHRPSYNNGPDACEWCGCVDCSPSRAVYPCATILALDAVQ